MVGNANEKRSQRQTSNLHLQAPFYFLCKSHDKNFLLSYCITDLEVQSNENTGSKYHHYVSDSQIHYFQPKPLNSSLMVQVHISLHLLVSQRSQSHCVYNNLSISHCKSSSSQLTRHCSLPSCLS